MVFSLSFQRPAFFAVRIMLAFISSICEAFLYRTVVDKVNYRAGRYMLFLMLFSAGMWSASVGQYRFCVSQSAH